VQQARRYGVTLGILAALHLPYTIVAAAQWKKFLRVSANKEAARARATELLPGAAHQWRRKRDYNRAEAALVALYGARSDRV
jgi:hypothetical protein